MSEHQKELLNKLQTEFPQEFYLRETPRNDKYGSYLLGWITLESPEPNKEYIEKITKLVRVLATHFEQNNPLGFFTLDNNIGDSSVSFKVYLTTV